MIFQFDLPLVKATSSTFVPFLLNPLSLFIHYPIFNHFNPASLVFYRIK